MAKMSTVLLSNRVTFNLAFNPRLGTGKNGWMLINTTLAPSPLSAAVPNPILYQAKRGGSKRSVPPEPVYNHDQVDEDDDELEFFDGITADDEFLDEDDLEDYDFEDEEDLKLGVGDGREGGGVVLAGTWWDKEALSLVEKVVLSFDGNIKLYAFRTTTNSIVQVRIENLANKYGSPTMADIEEFSSSYRTLLDEAEKIQKVPDSISLEVSSPGLERVVEVPEDLERFKELPLYVKYVAEVGSKKENDGIFKLVSYDLESKYCTWALADVRLNREQAGKGRPLTKKQREWKLETPFDCLQIVRRYSEW